MTITANSKGETRHSFISLIVKRHPRSRLLIGLFILALAAVPAVVAQGDVSFSAEVDKTTISLGDLLMLKLTVLGEFQQLGEPQFPVLDGIVIVGSSRSSRFNMVNGDVQARTIFTYRLRATSLGVVTIGPIKIVVDGSSYQTQPITVQVTARGAPNRTPASGEGPSPEPDEGPSPKPEGGTIAVAPAGLTGQDLFVEAQVDKTTPYLGQQITYSFRFYQAIDLLNQPRLNWPDFSGFWTESLTPNNTYEVTLFERRYRVTEIRKALFPTSHGQITIDPAKLDIPGSFFSGDLELATQPIGLDVQPLPPMAPDGFAGAVGRFDIEAWAEPWKTGVHEPVTLFVRISGEGNLTTLPDPTQKVEDMSAHWRAFEPQITTNVSQEGETIRGEKRFERLLVPKASGELIVPSFLIVFFDPDTATYERIVTEPLIIQVAPAEEDASDISPGNNSRQDITVSATDIRHIKPAPPSLATQRTLTLEQPLYWLAWLLAPMLVGGVWAWQRRRRPSASDIARARNRRARALARRQLSQARRQAADERDSVWVTVARALNGYFGDKFGLPSAGLTHDDIQRLLIDQDVPADLIQRSLACLDWADSGRFAPITAGEDASDLVTEAESVIAELDRFLSPP